MQTMQHIIAAFQVWINLYDDPLCQYLPAPTIQILVDAVYNIMGGNNQALATKIAGMNDSDQSMNI